MESIKEFFSLLPLWVWSIVAIVILLVIIFCLVNKRFKLWIYSLVVSAEENIKGNKKGEERYKQVVERIHAVLPKILQFIFTQTHINNLIERSVERMKKAIEKEKN